MTCRTALQHAAVAAALLISHPAAAQTSYGRPSQHDQAYGQPVDVSITDLEQRPDAYSDHAVRTRGTLDLVYGGRDQFMLRDSVGATVKIVKLEEVRDSFERQ